MKIFQCDLTLLENTFYSSREVGNFYQTEPFIGNYALCYALGVVNAPYFNNGSIFYAEHLSLLNDQGIYITPASIIGQPRFSVQQFNAQPDSYWFAMGNNTIVTKPDGWDVQQGSAWYLIERGTGTRKKVRTMNRPQIGRIKMLAIGVKARFYLITQATAPRIPAYIRLGKWMSKARLETVEVDFSETKVQSAKLSGLLNPLDLPTTIAVHTFDLLSVHPVPLFRNAVVSGALLDVGHGIYLPDGMKFGIEALQQDD